MLLNFLNDNTFWKQGIGVRCRKPGYFFILNSGHVQLTVAQIKCIATLNALRKLSALHILLRMPTQVSRC